MSSSPTKNILGLTILTSVLIIILVALGTWQLVRLKAKNQLIDSISANIAAEPIDINMFGASKPPLYTKVKLLGNFIQESTVFLYGRRSSQPEKDGYYLLTNFNSQNATYLVSRAWLPASAKQGFEEFSTAPAVIEAIVMPAEQKSFLMPDNDIAKRIWFTIDLKIAKKYLGTTEQGFYLMQINNHQLPNNFKPLTTNNLTKIRNDHLEYAITWYSLAASLLIIFILYRAKLLRG